jgi:hypothetical protein
MAITKPGVQGLIVHAFNDVESKLKGLLLKLKVMREHVLSTSDIPDDKANDTFGYSFFKHPKNLG